MDCPASKGPCQPRLVGDPVDVVTGANTDEVLDFKLDGPVPLLWRRHYSSLRHREAGPLGWGHAHEYQRSLRFDLDGMRYVKPSGGFVAFPVPARDGESAARDGVTLLRVSARVYHVAERDRPLLEFAFTGGAAVAPLSRVVRGPHALAFAYLEGRLAAITDPATGRAIEVASDDLGRIVRLTLAGSGPQDERRLCRYEYDAAGNLVRGVDPYGNAFGFAYDALNRMTRKTDRSGYAFEFVYDGKGRCVSSRGEDGLHEVHLRYLPVERATEVTKADGGVWLYQYDDAGTVTQIVDPYGGIQSFQLDEAGRLAQEIDETGAATTYLFGASGAPMAKVSPVGAVTPLGGNADTRPPKGHVLPAVPLEWEYGYLAQVLRHAGRAPGADAFPLPRDVAQAIARDPNARNAAGEAPWRTVRDRYGLQVMEIGAGGETRRWAYDPNGNIRRYGDANGAAYQRTYGSWNLLLEQTDPLGGVTRYRYTADEKLAAFVDPAGVESRYGYDLKGRCTEVARAGRTKESYRYDAAGRLVAKLDGAGGELLAFDLEPGGRIAGVRAAGGPSYKLGYDDAGRLVLAASAACKTEREYNAYGERAAELTDGLGVRHEYDLVGLVATTVLNRYTIRYEREGGVLHVVDPGGKRHRIFPLGNGDVARVMADRFGEVATFDASGYWRRRVVFNLDSGRGCWTREYRYSPEHTLTEVADNRRGTMRCRYDAANRLVAVVDPDGSTEEIDHDPAGNILRNAAFEHIAYDAGGRITGAGGIVLDHDARNRLARRGTGPEATTYHYDAYDMLVRCERPDGVWEASYDYFGRRVAKAWRGQATRYFWDRDRLAAEIAPDGRVRVYVYADIFALVPIMFVEYASLDEPAEAGRRFFLFHDQVGAPSLVLDGRGREVWKATTRPYGAVRHEVEPSIDLGLRFPGHLHDPEIGLHYNRFRYYDPQLGRYLQSDPKGIGGGLNLYAYPANPLARVDLRGLTCADHPEETDPECEECQRNEDTVITRRPGDQQPAAIERDREYGPNELDYYPVGEGSDIFTKHATMLQNPPPAEIKIHVSTDPATAQAVARSVLPKLRELGVPHKVVRDLERLVTQTESDQAGKFITIYCADPDQARAVVAAIDGELAALQPHGVVAPGPRPTTRESNHEEGEFPIGTSGMLWFRMMGEGGGD